MERVCVFGAGAVGGHLAVRLAQSDGVELSVLSRGTQLDAMRNEGLRLHRPDGSELHVRTFTSTDDAANLSAQDVVFVTVKAASQADIADDLASLIGSHGVAVFIANGLPWWWRYRSTVGTAPPPSLAETRLQNMIGVGRTLGGVVYSMNEVTAPGRIRHHGNDRWLIGEVEGPATDRVRRIVQLLCGAGLGAEASDDLGREVWIKLLKNAPINPVAALTRLDTDGIAADPRLVDLVAHLSAEVASLAAALDVDVESETDAARRALTSGGATAGGRARGVKPSMLQDALAGRRMEVDALLGSLVRWAVARGVPSPSLNAVHALVEGLDFSLRRTAASS